MNKELDYSIEPQPVNFWREVESRDFVEDNSRGEKLPYRLRRYQFDKLTIITRQNLYFAGAFSGPDWEDPQTVKQAYDDALPIWNRIFRNNIGGRKDLTRKVMQSYESYSRYKGSANAGPAVIFRNDFGVEIDVVEPVLEQISRAKKLKDAIQEESAALDAFLTSM